MAVIVPGNCYSGLGAAKSKASMTSDWDTMIGTSLEFTFPFAKMDDANTPGTSSCGWQERAIPLCRRVRGIQLRRRAHPHCVDRRVAAPSARSSVPPLLLRRLSKPPPIPAQKSLLEQRIRTFHTLRAGMKVCRLASTLLFKGEVFKSPKAYSELSKYTAPSRPSGWLRLPCPRAPPIATNRQPKWKQMTHQAPPRHGTAQQFKVGASSPEAAMAYSSRQRR